MESYALYSYQAASDTELSVDEGSTVKILCEKDPDWFLAEQNGQEGYVPSTYIQFNKPIWYRNLTKAEATTLLNQKKGSKELHAKGAFLVRPSESGAGDLSISVKIHSIEHFKVVRENGGYFIWRKASHFTSVDQLIDYYRRKSISKADNALLRDMKTSTVSVEYDYKAQTAEEMDIFAGESITLFDDTDGDWWKGQLERDGVSHRGCFPANYVSQQH